MTEKQYKLEQWTSSSLYYSFPDGNLHNGIGRVIARVESDLNSLYNENEQLKQREEILDSMIKTFDEGCKEIYDDKCRLEKENEELKLKNELLERDLHYCAKQFKEDVKNILLDLKSGLND